jgi:hypothetical protein
MCPGDSGPPAFTVIEMLPEQAMIIGHYPANEAERANGASLSYSWAFVLQPVDADTTRLVVRTRTSVEAGWMKLIELPSFIMERGMLRGIRERAER